MRASLVAPLACACGHSSAPGQRTGLLPLQCAKVVGVHWTWRTLANAMRALSRRHRNSLACCDVGYSTGREPMPPISGVLCAFHSIDLRRDELVHSSSHYLRVKIRACRREVSFQKGSWRWRSDHRADQRDMAIADRSRDRDESFCGDTNMTGGRTRHPRDAMTLHVHCARPHVCQV